MGAARNLRARRVALPFLLRRPCDALRHNPEVVMPPGDARGETPPPRLPCPHRLVVQAEREGTVVGERGCGAGGASSCVLPNDPIGTVIPGFSNPRT